MVLDIRYRGGLLRGLAMGLVLVVAGGTVRAGAQVVGGTGSPLQVEPPKPQAIIEPKVPLLTQKVRLADFDGMAPRAELRGQMTKIENFVQNTPNDGRPATQKTEAWMGRTETTLYVVFVCFDDHPELIRGHLTRRENILTDDTVSVLLDPFQDRRRGVIFQLNAAGVQADAAWLENNGSDYSYDQVWDSEGRVTGQGWMALFAIPFRSLRFRPGVADWGVVLTRSFPRNSEADNWPHISTNISGLLSQEGTLREMQSNSRSHNFQLNPYVVGQSEHTLLNLDPINPYFSTRHFEATGGGEAKLVLKESIVLDATVNPDFSDVESDQPQFTVNQRYPVYFPELRPFFLENANYFATPITLLYTRNIVHPEFGVRATGKVGGTNFGLLLSDDRAPGEGFQPGTAPYKKRATFGVGRVSQDVGKGSSVGVMYTDDEFAGTFSRVGGVDFTARLGDKWTAQGQHVVSSNRSLDGSYFAGPGTEFQISRNGHALNITNEYQDYARNFRTDVGFVQISNIRQDHTHGNYQWFPKHSVVQSFGLETNQNFAWDHQGNRVFHYSTFDPFWLLPRNIVLAPLVGQNSDTLGPQNGYLLTQNRNFTENFVGLVARGAPFAQMSFNLQAQRAGNVNYNPVAGAAPSLMHQDSVQLLMTLKPLRQLTADNTYLLDREHSARSGAMVYESQTLRTKINYQFTRAFSARVIVEYDSTLANPKETSLQRTKQVSTEALLTWLPHPGTAVYVGYNNDLQNLDRALCSRGSNGACDPGRPMLPRVSSYLNDGRQFFVKASYLLRF